MYGSARTGGAEKIVSEQRKSCQSRENRVRAEKIVSVQEKIVSVHIFGENRVSSFGENRVSSYFPSRKKTETILSGSFWKPVFNLLEGRFEVVLVNAHHIKQVPGRKIDVGDSEWFA